MSTYGPFDGSDLPPEDLTIQPPQGGGGGGAPTPTDSLVSAGGGNISPEATRWPSNGVKPFIGGLMI